MNVVEMFFRLLLFFLSYFLFFYPRLSVGNAPLTHPEKPLTIGQYLKQLSKHKNFMWFVSMNLVQVIWYDITRRAKSAK